MLRGSTPNQFTVDSHFRNMRYLYGTIADICHCFHIAVRTLDTLEAAVFDEKGIFFIQ